MKTTRTKTPTKSRPEIHMCPADYQATIRHLAMAPWNGSGTTKEAQAYLDARIQDLIDQKPDAIKRGRHTTRLATLQQGGLHLEMLWHNAKRTEGYLVMHITPSWHLTFSGPTLWKVPKGASARKAA